MAVPELQPWARLTQCCDQATNWLTGNQVSIPGRGRDFCFISPQRPESGTHLTYPVGTGIFPLGVKRLDVEVYGSNDSTKSPASGIPTVSEPKLNVTSGRVREVVCASISVLLQSERWRCQYSCGPWRIGSQNTNRMPPVTPGILDDLCCLPHVAAAKWVGRGGHLASDTWWLSLWKWRWKLSLNIARSLWITRGIISSSVLQSHSALHTQGNVRNIGTRPCLSYSTAIQIGQEIN